MKSDFEVLAETPRGRNLITNGLVIMIAALCVLLLIDSPNYEGRRFTVEQGLGLLYFGSAVFFVQAIIAASNIYNLLTRPAAVYVQDGKIMWVYGIIYKSVLLSSIDEVNIDAPDRPKSTISIFCKDGSRIGFTTATLTEDAATIAARIKSRVA